ncbi:MAG: putative Ig domain-containing protein [Acidimicrobiales bacterium]
MPLPRGISFYLRAIVALLVVAVVLPVIQIASSERAAADSPPAAPIVITGCDFSFLQAALASSSPTVTVEFATGQSQCTLNDAATISISSGRSVTIDGTDTGANHYVVLDGEPSPANNDSAVQLFDVKSGGTLSLRNITLENGAVTGATGDNFTEENPPSPAAAGSAGGQSGMNGTAGGPGASGQVPASDDMDGDQGSSAGGGALRVETGGAATLIGDTLQLNSATGGNGGTADVGQAGGAGGNGGGGLNQTATTGAGVNGGAGGTGGTGGSGGNGGAGGNAQGGAVYNAGTLTLSNDVFDQNTVTGGDGSDGGTGGAGGSGGLGGDPGNGGITSSAPAVGGIGGNSGANGKGGTGGAGGAAEGGAVYSSGVLTILGGTFDANTATGGKGGAGGAGTSTPGIAQEGGGDDLFCQADGTNCYLAGNVQPSDASGRATPTGATGGVGGNGGTGGTGGTGGAGGAAEGGGIFSSGPLIVASETGVGSSIENNVTTSGPGGLGGNGGISSAGGNGGDGGVPWNVTSGTGGSGGAGGNAGTGGAGGTGGKSGATLGANAAISGGSNAITNASFSGGTEASGDAGNGGDGGAAGQYAACPPPGDFGPPVPSPPSACYGITATSGGGGAGGIVASLLSGPNQGDSADEVATQGLPGNGGNGGTGNLQTLDLQGVAGGGGAEGNGGDQGNYASGEGSELYLAANTTAQIDQTTVNSLNGASAGSGGQPGTSGNAGAGGPAGQAGQCVGLDGNGTENGTCSPTGNPGEPGQPGPIGTSGADATATDEEYGATPPAAVSVPGTPTNVTALEGPGGSVDVSWQPPPAISGGPVLNYLIESDNSTNGQSVVYDTGLSASSPTNSDGTLTFPIYAGLTSGSTTYYVAAENWAGEGTAGSSSALSGTAPSVSGPSRWSSPEGEPFSAVVATATGTPTPAVTASVPPWMTVSDNGDGQLTISGTPPAGSAGTTYPFTISGTNAFGTADQSFTFTSDLVPTSPPTVSVPATPVLGMIDSPLSVNITTTADPPQITESGALPAGVTFAVNGDGSATLAGAPEPGSVGTYDPTFSATDAQGTGSAGLTLVVLVSPTTVQVSIPVTSDVGNGIPPTANVTATASVTPASNAGSVNEGTVAFEEATEPSATTFRAIQGCSSQPVNDSAASCPFTAKVGSYVMQAVYSGSAPDFDGSTGQSTAFYVDQPGVTPPPTCAAGAAEICFSNAGATGAISGGLPQDSQAALGSPSGEQLMAGDAFDTSTTPGSQPDGIFAFAGAQNNQGNSTGDLQLFQVGPNGRLDSDGNGPPVPVWSYPSTTAPYGAICGNDGNAPSGPDGADCQFMAAADVNGDGLPDFVIYNQAYEGSFTVYEDNPHDPGSYEPDPFGDYLSSRAGWSFPNDPDGTFRAGVDSESLADMRIGQVAGCPAIVSLQSSDNPELDVLTDPMEGGVCSGDFNNGFETRSSGVSSGTQMVMGDFTTGSTAATPNDDVAVIDNRYSNTVSVYAAQGDGSTIPAHTITLGGGYTITVPATVNFGYVPAPGGVGASSFNAPNGTLLSADLTGGTYDDLIVTNSTGTWIYVPDSSGDGGFQSDPACPQQTLTVPCVSMETLATASFNGGASSELLGFQDGQIGVIGFDSTGAVATTDFFPVPYGMDVTSITPGSFGGENSSPDLFLNGTLGGTPTSAVLQDETNQTAFALQTIGFTSNDSNAFVGGSYTVSANGGASGVPVSYSIDPSSSSVCSNVGSTVTFTAVGNCVIDANQAGNGTYAAAMQVSQTVSVAANSSGTAPVITSSDAATAAVGVPFSFGVIATGTPSPTYSLLGAPSWLSIDSTTGVLSGTPPAGSSRTDRFTITASNGLTPDATQSFTLVVQPIEITTSSLPSGFLRVGYSTTLAAIGGNPPYSWKVVSGNLPKGLKLDKTTGVISGTPSKTSSTATVTIEVQDTKTVTKPKTRNSTTKVLRIVIS